MEVMVVSEKYYRAILHETIKNQMQISYKIRDTINTKKKIEFPTKIY